MPLKKKKVLGRPLHLVPVRDRAALEIVKGKADECLTPSPGAWVAPKVRQSRNCRLEPALDALRHGLGRNAVAVVQGRQGAGVQELVRQRHLPELRRYAVAQQRR